MAEQGAASRQAESLASRVIASLDIRERFADPKTGERWGYLVWGTGALIILTAEIAAAAHLTRRWPTISATVGHLEYRWSWVALLVVAVIVFAAFHVLRYPLSEPGPVVQANRRTLGRTEQGRFTFAPERTKPRNALAPAWLAAGAVIVVAGILPVWIINPANKFIFGYILYGLLATCFVIVPSALAFFFAKDVPFAPLFRTIADLERRAHFAGVLILIGLAILLIHLALYPWPGVFHQLKPPTPDSL